MCLKSDEEEIAKCQDNSLGGHVYYDELEIEPGSLEDEPEIRDDDVASSLLPFKHSWNTDMMIERKLPSRGALNSRRTATWSLNSSTSTGRSNGTNYGRLLCLKPNCYPPVFAKPQWNSKTKYSRRQVEKLIDLSKRRRLKHKAHADMSDKISTLTTLIWRLIMLVTPWEVTRNFA